MCKYLILIVLLSQAVFAQSFEKKSAKLSFDIKVPPPDVEPPVIKLTRPLKYGHYPIYSKDTMFTVAGNVTDNSNKTMIIINNIKEGYRTNGPFKFDVKLNHGENYILVTAADKKGNIARDTLEVVQDPLSENNPPIVKILQPKILTQRGIKVVSKFENTDSLLTIKGTVSDESDMLGIWINKMKIPQTNGNEFQYTFNKGYTDSVLIEAADKYGNLYSEVITVSKEKLADNNDQAIKYFAVIITVEDYKDKKIEPLDNPVKDGAKLKQVLTGNYTFEEKNIHHLKNPTREEIMSEFQKLRKTLGVNDNLLIFYAGHGYWDEEIQQGYWLPSDAKKDNQSNWITNSIIKDYIKSFKTKHTLLIADACFAGNFLRSINDKKNSEMDFQDSYQYPSRTAMTSGTKSGKVPDRSVFIDNLIQKLETNQEKYWLADQLFQSIKSTVTTNTPDRQVPAYGIIQETGDEGGLGDFIFVRK